MKRFLVIAWPDYKSCLRCKTRLPKPLIQLRSGGVLKKVLGHRSQFSTADGEYTAAQRRVIDSRLAEGEKGPFYGPFKDGDEIAAFMKKKQRSAKPTKFRKLR